MFTMSEENEAVPKNRRFYSIPKDDLHGKEKTTHFKENKEELLRYISENIIGNDKIFSGPFGLRKVTYLDFIASGRAVKFIEDYIQNEVLPDYGNTHTTTGITSLQTTLYRHESRDIVRNAVHASEHDSVIFCGSGCTAAVHKLIHALNLKQSPVVFVSPYEHHSTLLPWKEAGAKVIRIKQDKDGQVSLDDLQRKLKKWQSSGRQMIGCFSAASNITGILVDVDTVTICLHRHGALAFWDYATAAPYVKIDMNPVLTSEDQAFVYKDAIFMSTHKFIGGVSTPGVLVAKKKLFRNKTPDKCGGGSVFFVRRDGHRYLQEPEMKEEAGTPAIVESIRAGLVFQLKEAVSADTIMEKEHQLFSVARDAWRDCKNLVLLGNLDDVARLPVFSFLILHPSSGRFLHYNFVASLLNDLFGIQARGGCACAGPYAMDMLGLDEVTAHNIEELLAEDNRLDRTHLRRYREYSQREIIRPGFVRINLPYFMTEDTLQFVIEAVKLVAEHGWKLLPQYMFNPETGEWRQKHFQVFKDRKWLGHISYNSGEMKYKVPPHVIKGPLPDNYQDCLKKAEKLFHQAEKTRYQLPDHTQMFDSQSQQYRWFLLPSEAASHLSNNPSSSQDFVLPFCPPHIRELVGLPAFVPGGHESDDEIPVQRNPSSCQEDLTSHAVQNIIKKDGVSDLPPFAHGMTSCLDQGFVSDVTAQVTDNIDDVTTHSVDNNDSCESVDKNLTSNDTYPVRKSSENLSMDKHEATVSGNFNTCDKTGNFTEISVEESSGTVIVDQGDINGPSSESVKQFQDERRPNSPIKERVGVKHKTDEGNVTDLEKNSSEFCLSSKRRKIEECEQGVCPLNSVPSVDQQQQNNKVKNGKASDDSNKPGGKSGRKGRAKSGWFSPPKCIFTQFLKGVEDYNMIQNGDRILVCLSGGKDSLSLLHTVRQYQFYCRSKGIKFEFGAVTVDPQTPSYDPSPLKEYLSSLGVPYFYESQCIMEQAKNLDYECASICSFCSRMKRGRIYASARREGYNVLALGQHLDDLCESFIMSIFHNGLLRTMKAHYKVQEGDLRVIRPFVYVREKDLRTFAEQNKLPVIAENCPACFESPKERHRTKQLLASQEILFPQLYNSMMAALKPIMAVSKTGVDIRKLLRQGQNENDEDDMDI